MRLIHILKSETPIHINQNLLYMLHLDSIPKKALLGVEQHIWLLGRAVAHPIQSHHARDLRLAMALVEAISVYLP